MIYQLAKKDGLQRNKEFRENIEDIRRQALINFYIQEKVDKSAQVTDEEISAFYTENKDSFSEYEARNLSHILVDTKSQATKILGEFKAGAKFETLAQKYSKDNSKARGGQLGWVRKGDLVPEFGNVAFTMKTKNEVSDVVKTEFGYHIIKLTDLQPEQVKAYDDVKADLRAELEQTEKVDAFYEKQTEMGALAFEISDRLDDVAEVADVEVKTTPLVARNALPEPLNTPAVISQLFSVELLEDKVNSEVIELGDEHVIVVRVNKYEPSATKPLAQVSEQIKTRLVNEKASTLAKEKARELFAQVQAGKTLSDVASEQNLTVREEASLTRQSYTVSPAIVTQAFKMPRPNDAPSTDVVDLNNGDAAIVALKSVSDAQVTANIDPQVQQNITMAQANKNYLAFIESLKAKAELNLPVVEQAAE